MPKMVIQFPQCYGLLLGSLQSGLTPWKLQESLQGLTTGNLFMIEKGKELAATSNWTLADSVPT